MAANEICTAHRFEASGEEIYAAFQQPERLARWWRPAGFTNTFHSFEFKPGGEWKFTMHSPEGTNFPNESQFVAQWQRHPLVVRRPAERWGNWAAQYRSGTMIVSGTGWRMYSGWRTRSGRSMGACSIS
jgi:uncharacterized protein YndB with AHSA1/START domain